MIFFNFRLISFPELNACNYRPVSLTCVPCKLLEHILCSNIMACLDEYKLLSGRQHAFRKGHSCETQLTTVINDWAKILDNRGQVGWMDTFGFYVPSTVFQSFRDDGRVNTKGSVQ